MNKERWQKIESIIEDSWRFKTMREKKRYAKTACKKDLTLYYEVVGLLVNMQKAEQEKFLE